MIRNLKALGLALVALLASSAMVASAASAGQGELTSDGNVTLKGTDIAGSPSTFTQFGQTLSCKESHYTGHRYNVTPHVFIQVPATTITVTPTYTNCLAAGLLSTVTMNGCDYVLHIGNSVEAGKYGFTMDIVCPAGAQIEKHIYASATKENVVACTIKFPAQTGLTGGFVKNLAGGKLTLGGPITGITSSKEGGCGVEENKLGVLDIDIEIEGRNEAAGVTAVEITG